jgi:hypothetical protein
MEFLNREANAAMETEWVPKRGSPPIYWDFNRTLPANSFRLDHPALLAELARQCVELHDGLRLNLWDADGNGTGERDDLVATGIVRRDSDEAWIIEIDAWAHVSDHSI